MGRTAVLGVAVLAFVGAIRVRRELLADRECETSLAERWSAVPGLAGAPTLHIHAREGGHRRVSPSPVVLVHGWGIGTSYLIPLAARLSKGVRVYAPDLPGHGRSEHDVRPLAIEEHARALASWMDIRNLRSAILVGHSLGSQIVAEVAAHRSDLVSAVVLIGPTSDPLARTHLQQLLRAFGSVVFERPSLLVWAALDYARAGLYVLAAEAGHMITHRPEDVLPKIPVPVRVLRGGRDRIAPQQWAEAVARLTSSPRPAVIAGWGHAVHYDDPDAIAREVLEFAGALNTSPPAPQS